MDSKTPTEVQPGNEAPQAVLMTTLKGMSQEELCGALVEKEYELECAQDLLQSLSVYEVECQRKNGVIQELRREVAAYKHNSHSKDISYVTMEEHLQACEDHLQLKNKEVESLRQEVKALNNKASKDDTRLSMISTSTSKISVLQKELSCKTSEILKMKQEVQQLKTQHERDQETVASLRHNVTELQANLASEKAKMQQIKSINEDLKQKLKASECEKEQITAVEQKRKEEVGKLKRTISTGKLAQAKQDFLEAEVEKTKLKENELASQLGKVKEELSLTCQRVVSIGTSVITPSGDPSAISVVEQLAQECVNCREEMEQTQAQMTEVQTESESIKVILTSLKQLWTNFKDTMGQAAGVSNPSESVGLAIEVLVTALRDLSSQKQTGSSKTLISAIEESLSLVNSSLVSRWSQLITEIEGHYSRHELSCEETEEPAKKLVLLSETLQSQKEECVQLNLRLQGIEEEHRNALLAVTKEGEEKLTKAIEECLLTEKEKFSHEMQAVQQQLEEEKVQSVSKEQEQNAMISEQLESTKKLLLAERNQTDMLCAERTGLEAKLQSLEVSSSEALITAESAKETLRSQLVQEMVGYREQSHQHALTIVALEQKLIQVMESSKRLKAENEALSEVVHSTCAQSKQKGSNDEQVEKLVKLTDTLRHQLCLTNEESTKSQKKIEQLESDLHTIKSQINDREALMAHQCQEQINDLKLTLSKQENALEGKNKEIAHLKALLQDKATQTADMEAQKNKALKKASELKEHLERIGDSSNPVATEVIQLGQRCCGEKHTDTITNQRRAIAQLREQISELELAKPPVGSHQATLKELSRVRHELLKAKAESTKPPIVAAEHTSDESQAELEMMNEQNELKVKDLQASITELRDSLQCSEKTYKHLVDVICKNVADIDKQASRSIGEGRNAEEKKDILRERRTFTDILLKSLRTLQHKASSPATNGLKDLKSGTLQGDSPETTIVGLQAVLDSTTEELEQQRRLNQALIKRSVFKESQLAKSSRRPHHQCMK